MPKEGREIQTREIAKKRVEERLLERFHLERE